MCISDVSVLVERCSSPVGSPVKRTRLTWDLSLVDAPGLIASATSALRPPPSPFIENSARVRNSCSANPAKCSHIAEYFVPDNWSAASFKTRTTRCASEFVLLVLRARANIFPPILVTLSGRMNWDHPGGKPSRGGGPVSVSGRHSGRCEASNPESIAPQQHLEKWIPGSRSRAPRNDERAIAV